MIDRLSALWFWIRYGPVVERVRAGGYWEPVMEIEYLPARTGRTVGYWAYGSFDPSLPYRGQSVFVKTTIEENKP